MPPTKEKLIGEDLAAGLIDYPTSLLYRAQALSGDNVLPSKYGSAPLAGDDGSLTRGMLDAATPDAIRKQLLAFLGRPTSPASFYLGAGVSPSPVARVPGGLLLTADVACAPNTWISSSSTKYPGSFKVWTMCSAGYSTRLDAMIAVLEKYWGPETDLMGQPLSDADPFAADPSEYGGDGGIDFYALPAGVQLTREGKTHTLAGLAGALAVPTNITGKKASGYVLLGEANVTARTFDADVVHELFHILQDSHNYQVMSMPGGQNPAVWQSSWYTEAGAAWAEGYFVQPHSGDPYRYVSWFQRASYPLDATDIQGGAAWSHTYGSMMWYLFMEQQAGAAVIGEIWKDLEAADDEPQATAYFDKYLPFADNFKTFAARNLDQSGLHDVLGTSYQDLNADMPYVRPQEAGTLTLSSQSPDDPAKTTLAVALPHLDALYYRINLGLDVTQVEWVLNGQDQSQDLHLQVFWHLGYSWSTEDIASGGSSCGLAGVDYGVLVVSNGSLTGQASASLSGRALKNDCGVGATPTPSESASPSPTPSESASPSPSPEPSPVPSPLEYYVFALTNIEAPAGEIYVGALDEVKGAVTCAFVDGGLCTGAGGHDIPVTYEEKLGPYPDNAGAVAAYCHALVESHAAYGGVVGTIFGHVYFLDNAPSCS
jgi:hypothetical protein